MSNTQNKESSPFSIREGSGVSLDSKIYIAGHRGLVGSAIWNNLKARGYNNLVGRTHKELDLLDPVAVKQFFDEEQKLLSRQSAQ